MRQNYHMAKKTENKKQQYYEAVGRRKEATARARLYVLTQDTIDIGGVSIKKGDIMVNKKPVEQFFPGETAKSIYLEPFRTTNTVGRFTVSALVTGGGTYGQMGAFIHAVSRALLEIDKDKFRPILKKRGFLKRDPRMKERRKAGLAQKARAKKQSPKR